MTFNDLSISESAIETTGVQSQPDTLTGTAAENKLVFDALPRLIVARFNSLITQLQAQAAAEQLGVTPFTGMTATNLQDALEALQTNLTQAIAGVGTGLAGSSGAASVGFDSTEQITAATVQAAIEAVQQHLDAFKTQMTGSGGAASVGTAPISGLDATNVQAALAELRDDIQNIVSGIIPGGTITTNMLADGSVTAEKLNVTGEDIPTSASDPTTISSQLSNLNTLVGGATTPQAALHALGAGVRPNLLDNWYFVGGGTQGKFPINQKGVTSSDDVAKNVIFIDRWKRSGAEIHTMTLSDAGITTNGTAECQMCQWQEVDDFLGRTVTFSLFTSAGLFSGAVEIPASMPASNQTLYAYNDGNVALAILLLSANNLLQFQPMASSVMTFYAVKAEIGDTQTLCYQDEDGNWHLLPQPESDYATQLSRCQRYYEQTKYFVFYASALNATEIQFGDSYQFEAEKRVAPVITVNPTPLQELQVRDATTGVLINGCTLQVPIAYNGGMLSPKITSENFEQGKLYRVQMPDNAYLVSAEL